MTIQATGAAENAAATASPWPAILTWRGHTTPRMESVRVQLNGNRIKASARIIGGACPEHPAFSASYDLVTDEAGVTSRLSLRSTLKSGEQQMSINRDEEGYWMVESSAAPAQRSQFGGALDVDVALSPFFNTLPIRRLGLHHEPDDVQVPVVYVYLPKLEVKAATLTYSSGSDGIHVISPVSTSTVTVDNDGFLLDYPGLAERI